MRTILALAGVAVTATATLSLTSSAGAETSAESGADGSGSGSAACSARVDAVGYSDALDKAEAYGAEVSGLSSLAWDARQHAWVSALDNDGSTPSYLWSLRDLAHPRITHAPLVLKRSDGTAYDGTSADDEGLAVLPDGGYLVSSEAEPSIRVFGRDGIEREPLPMPERFAVSGTTAGEATENATLEGLTITPDGKTVVASMEGALSGDTGGDDATAHRLLVYTRTRGDRFRIAKQIEYRTEPGMRTPEIAAYDDDSIVVEEAGWSEDAGNSVDLYAVTGLSRAADVSRVRDLGTASPRLAVKKTHLADLTDCPTLGASALENQTNPLLDNFEGMAVTGRRPGRQAYELAPVSDDNNSATQRTRILDLTARLP